ncbi:cupin domain-containing protein [Novosphingobium decolorationis]|uniref:ChrR-like cupin domain-containing protein n=1 Tax=Novosphingobium decolorationis TaxID=2698673 RepID=A0ABX8E5Z6_9SPHN|nr:hypothetical protein [Novosphingobium decolorationis]MED5545054.1 hypothetical protein [Pseudomonadota bacterium]QVM83636.1 hypothetical protein HT578_07965 [Novosphingobium decolorationis]
MRPRVVDLRVDELDWEPLGPPGLYSRLLSRDEETGARTALQRMVPADGYTAPDTAHYHHTYEELLGVSGRFSFDGRNWVEAGAYLFHPPRTVHGFASTVPEESTFLSRVGRQLDFNFVPEPAQDDLYLAEGSLPPRAPVALEKDAALDGFAPSRFLGADVEARVLSVDPETGEGSAFVRLPAGWQSMTAALPHYLEIFAISGAIGVDGGAAAPGRAYFFYPAQDRINTLEAAEPTLAYVNFGGPVGL